MHHKALGLASALVAFSMAALPACAVEESEEESGNDRSSIVGGQMEDGTPSVGYLVWGGTADQRALPSCSGTLIAPNAFLLAAHCVPHSQSVYSVGFGRVGSRPLVPVAEVIRNTGYNYGRVDLQTDIAVLILGRTVTDIVPASLATTATPPANCNYRVFGYGTTNEQGNDLSGQRKSLQECFLRREGASGMIVQINNQQICFGDSGGPLMYAGSSTVLGVAGMVSGVEGRACARGFEAGYTSVAAHRGLVDNALNRALARRAASAPPPRQVGGCGEVPAGFRWTNHEFVTSCNGRHHLVMQWDGNLVLHQPKGPKWSSGTSNRINVTAVFQGDGNLVAYMGSTPLWSSQTPGRQGAKLHVQDDGNVVIYDRAGKPIWATNTVER